MFLCLWSYTEFRYYQFYEENTSCEVHLLFGGSFVSGGGGTLCSTTEVLQIHVCMKGLHRPGIVLQKGTGDLSQGPLFMEVNSDSSL